MPHSQIEERFPFSEDTKPFSVRLVEQWFFHRYGHECTKSVQEFLLTKFLPDLHTHAKLKSALQNLSCKAHFEFGLAAGDSNNFMALYGFYKWDAAKHFAVSFIPFQVFLLHSSFYYELNSTLYFKHWLRLAQAWSQP